MTQSFRLYASALHPRQWIAWSDATGWVQFPNEDNGWELRKSARGLDPVHLRATPLREAANTGIPTGPVSFGSQPRRAA
ncbi:MAG TPA: hypothetical protein VFQ79_24440 [Bryobacteraceae bacterium]|nr:hypothetical protein [Bryobacteraceae bacterium]